MSNKKLTLAITGTAFAFGSLGVLAAPAGAHHQHYLDTPGHNVIALPCEPDAVSMIDPEHHPRHDNLHKGPAELIRPITLGMIADCDAPIPNGPIGD